MQDTLSIEQNNHDFSVSEYRLKAKNKQVESCAELLTLSKFTVQKWKIFFNNYEQIDFEKT